MVSTDWASLHDELQVADVLYGDHGRESVASWLDTETSRVTDPSFARLFSEHVELPGIAPDDYLHRIIRTSHGDLLGGIRFYGRDVSRPFIEIIAHTFASLDRLRDCVRGEWSMFAPESLRLCARPGRITGPNVVLDLSIYVARYRDMPPPVALISLAPFVDADAAIGMVRRRYGRLAADDPRLARNVAPETVDDLREWHDDGQLRAIMAGDKTVGLLAVAPGCIRWINGDEIQEEVVDVEHSGRGYAALAQAAWANDVAPDPNQLLIGTIDGLNVASRKTAERAGRRRVLDMVFVSL